MEVPKTLLSIITKDALLSGIVNSAAFMLDGFVESIKKEYSELGNILVILTGGLSTLISKVSQKYDILDHDLILDGLSLICQKD